MRDCARVPELCNHAAAGCMDGIRDASPSADLLLRPQSWRIGPAKSFRANRGGLGDDQSGRSTLRVILCLQRSGHMIMRLRAHPGERRHDDAVRKIEVSHPIWCEKWLIRHPMNSLHGCGAYGSCFVLECSHRPSLAWIQLSDLSPGYSEPLGYIR